MPKELVIIYDTPSITHTLIQAHNLVYYFRFFDKIRVLYWSKDKVSEVFNKENGRLIFYPYTKPYSSKYLTGLKYMFWIGKALWQICQATRKQTKLIFMPIMPIWPGIPAIIVAKLKRKKIVLRLEAQKIQYMKREAELFKKQKLITFIKLSAIKIIYYCTLRFYNAVIGICDDLTAVAKKYGAKQALTIPIIINEETFIGISNKDKSAYQQTVILYAGQIKNIKGIEYLVKAIRLLKERDNLLPKLVVAGAITNVKDESYFKDICHAAVGLDVDWIGRISHEKIHKIYARADIFVLPSLTEALGMATMEAMVSGLPVIASRTSGSQYLVEHGHTGFLVQPQNAQALKDKLKILIKDLPLRRSMGRHGKQRIQYLLQQAMKNDKKLWKTLLK